MEAEDLAKLVELVIITEKVVVMAGMAEMDARPDLTVNRAKMVSEVAAVLRVLM